MEPSAQRLLTLTTTMSNTRGQTRSDDLEEERLTKRQRLASDMGTVDDSNSPELTCSLACLPFDILHEVGHSTLSTTQSLMSHADFQFGIHERPPPPRLDWSCHSANSGLAKCCYGMESCSQGLWNSGPASAHQRGSLGCAVVWKRLSGSLTYRTEEVRHISKD